MPFANLLKKLLENSIQFFNTGDYTSLGELIVENVIFTAPKYDNDKIFSPEVCFRNQKDVFEYWQDLHQRFEFQVTHIEYVKVGKISILKNSLPGIGYIVNTEIHFDEYGRVVKILNTIAGTL